MSPSPSFGARLRRERERRNISIASIAESTKILGALLEGLENDDVSRWPTGLYRRAFIRAYASAIGLDPEATVREFLERFPDPEAAPITAAAGTATTSATSQTPATTTRSELPMIPAGKPSPTGRVRIVSPRFGAWFAGGAVVNDLRLRALAAATDCFVLAVVGLAAFTLIGELWAPMCVAAVVYYAGAILFLGNTPGVCLFADPERTIRNRRPAWLASSDDGRPRPDTPWPAQSTPSP